MCAVCVRATVRRLLLITCDSHEFVVRVSNNSDASKSCAYHTDTHRCAMRGSVCLKQILLLALLVPISCAYHTDTHRCTGTGTDGLT
jgi:hypothetical protein